MQELLQTKLPDGQVVWVRTEFVEDEFEDQSQNISWKGRIHSIAGFTEAVRGVAANVLNAARPAAPDEVSAEFGLEFAMGDKGLVAALVGVGARASVKVTVSWTRVRPEQSAPGQSKPAAG